MATSSVLTQRCCLRSSGVGIVNNNKRCGKDTYREACRPALATSKAASSQTDFFRQEGSSSYVAYERRVQIYHRQCSFRQLATASLRRWSTRRQIHNIRALSQSTAVAREQKSVGTDSDASTRVHNVFVPVDRKFVVKPPPIWKRVPEVGEAQKQNLVNSNPVLTMSERLSLAERKAARKAGGVRGISNTPRRNASSYFVQEGAGGVPSAGDTALGAKGGLPRVYKNAAPKQGGENAARTRAEESAASSRGGESVASKRGWEASTSGSSGRNNVEIVGTLYSDASNEAVPSDRKNKAPIERHAVGSLSSAKAASSDRVNKDRSFERQGRWERQPERASHVRQPQTFKATVKEVASILRRLGEGLRIESAVQDTVPKTLLDEMDLEDWNETLKLLGKGRLIHQMQAVLAYLETTDAYEPNEASYARVFFGLHRSHNLGSALDVFNAMRVSKFPPTTSMYNAAMSMLIKQGNKMPLIEELFEEMLQRDIVRDKISYSIMMDAVWRAGTRTVRGKKDSRLRDATPKDKRDAAVRVEALYEQMLAEGLTPDTIVQNTVLYALIGSGAFKRAEELFRKMQGDQRTPPNDRSYTMMMHMYSERNEQEKLQEVFREMVASGIPPTDITYNVRIKACQGTKDVREAIRLFREMSAKELTVSNITYNSLVEVLASAGYFAQAEQIIYGMEVKGIELSPEPYNMLITGLIRAKECYCDEAMRIFKAMQLARVKPWALTFGALMEGFGKAGRLQEMEQIYRMMRYAKLQPTTTIFTAMIHAYIRADDLETAWDLFINMRDIGLVPNVQTYTVLVKGFAARGELDMVEELLAEAKEELTELDAVIYETVILAYVAANNLAPVDSLCKEMEDAHIQMLPHTYDKLASLHATAGRHNLAEEVMQRKQAAYPELDEQRGTISYGWLKYGYDSEGEEAERPLVLDDIWQVLENPNMSIESRSSVPC